jgi:hypothetical protein
MGYLFFLLPIIGLVAAFAAALRTPRFPKPVDEVAFSFANENR